MDKWNRILTPVALIAALLLPAIPASAARIFTDTQGRQIEAEIIDMRESDDGTLMVELRRTDRLYFTIAVDRFSKKDRDYLTERWEKQKADETLLDADARIKINLKLNRKSNTNNQYSSYYGSRWTDKTQVYSPEAVIENDELTRTFEGNQVRIVIIARDKSNTSQYLVASATDAKVNLPAKERTSVEGDTFALREYDYDSALTSYSSRYGYEKDDYVVVIRNRKGEITHTRASSNKFLENLDVVLECKAGEMYTEGLAGKLSVSPNSYYLQ